MSTNPKVTSGLLDLVADCLRLIISFVDLASIPSLALTSKFFTFRVIPIEKDYYRDDSDDSEEEEPPTTKPPIPMKNNKPDDSLPAQPENDSSPPLLSLPSTLRGQGVLISAVEHDHPSLFDYWAPLVKLKGPRSIFTMMNHAGSIGPRQRSLEWIAKIQVFLFANPKIAYTTTYWGNYSEGVIKSNRVAHYQSVLGSITNESQIREHLDSAIEMNATKIGDHILATHPNISFFAFDERDREPCGANEVGRVLGTTLTWYLNVISGPRGLIPDAKKGEMLGMLLRRTKTVESAKILLTHPFFAQVEDADVISNGWKMPRDVVFTLLSFRPGLLSKWNLFKYFWTAEQLDPRAIPIIKSFTSQKLRGLLKSYTLLPAIFEQIMVAMEPKIGYADCDGWFLRYTIRIYKDFSDAIRYFYPSGVAERDAYLKYILVHYDSRLHELLGKDIFTDEKILLKMREKAKKVEKVEEAPVKKKKAVAKKAVPKHYESDDELGEDSAGSDF